MEGNGTWKTFRSVDELKAHHIYREGVPPPFKLPTKKEDQCQTPDSLRDKQ